MFNKPTLITITAPTCSGKSYLIGELMSQGFTKIVSTTTREPRADELQGIDYDFITLSKSVYLEQNDFFAELIDFHGVRYGVTHFEIDKKMSGDLPPVMIVEPRGLALYEKYCKLHDWKIFKIFVNVDENLRVDRLNKRTLNEILYSDESKIKNIIEAHSSRLFSIFGAEREWFFWNKWDIVVPGNDIDKAVSLIKTEIKRRNKL